MKVVLFLLISSRLLLQAVGNPWAQVFTPKATFHVSPVMLGTGAGDKPENAKSITTAIRDAKAGDLFLLREGTYFGPLTFSNSGTSSNPIVFKADSVQRAIIDGKVQIKGAHTWIWGLEITDPKGGLGRPHSQFPSGTVDLQAAGDRLINNIIHDTWDCGIGAGYKGPGQVVYGNIVYKVGQHEDPAKRCYPIYTQNVLTNFFSRERNRTYAGNGYKYFIQNMLLDIKSDVGGPGYNFNAYSKNEPVCSGFHVQQNVMRDGRFLIGTESADPSYGAEVIENYFWETYVELGYKRPVDARFINNYLGRSYLGADHFWGAGEVLYPDLIRPNVFTGNHIYFPPKGQPHFSLTTEVYHTVLPAAGGYERCRGCKAVNSADTWNQNSYSAPFEARVWANDKNWGILSSFADWRRASLEAGKPGGFDSDPPPGLTSNVVTKPADKVVLLRNEYDPRRGHLVIYNWSKSASLTVDLSSVVTIGSRFKVVDPKNAYGAPMLSGSYAGPVKIPAHNKEFLAFIVIMERP